MHTYTSYQKINETKITFRHNGDYHNGNCSGNVEIILDSPHTVERIAIPFEVLLRYLKWLNSKGY